MTDIVHDSYIDHLGDGFSWASADIRAAVFDKQTWTPAKSDMVLLDVTAAGAIELSAPSYARTALTSLATTLDGAGHRKLQDAAVVDFGTLEAGYDFDTFVLYVFVTDDSDSWLIASVDVSDTGPSVRTTDGTDVLFVPDADGIFELRQP